MEQWIPTKRYKGWDGIQKKITKELQMDMASAIGYVANKMKDKMMALIEEFYQYADENNLEYVNTGNFMSSLQFGDSKITGNKMHITVFYNPDALVIRDGDDVGKKLNMDWGDHNTSMFGVREYSNMNEFFIDIDLTGWTFPEKNRRDGGHRPPARSKEAGQEYRTSSEFDNDLMKSFKANLWNIYKKQ